MHSQQITWNPQAGWTPVKAEPEKVSLVFYFGTRQMLACGNRHNELREMFPAAHILGCSTGGQINNSDISDDEIVAAAISFDATRLRLVRQDISDAQQSRKCGETIGRDLRGEDLAGVFVLSDGLNVNGSELVNGLVATIGSDVPLTGGLAGDGADFTETLVGGDCVPRARMVVGIGFYGSAIRIGHGSAGGWDLFGPRRQVTKSIGNVLFELDGQPALDLRYLGPEDSKGLPGSALLFPIQVHDANHPDSAVVRTVLAVDKIKIDRCFVDDIAEPDGSACIVQAIVNIAAERHMTTTAEGVETQQQRELLRALGCAEMQGYLFSPPQPAAEINRLCLSHSARRDAVA